MSGIGKRASGSKRLLLTSTNQRLNSFIWAESSTWRLCGCLDGGGFVVTAPSIAAAGLKISRSEVLLILSERRRKKPETGPRICNRPSTTVVHYIYRKRKFLEKQRKILCEENNFTASAIYIWNLELQNLRWFNLAVMSDTSKTSCGDLDRLISSEADGKGIK